MFCIYSYYFFHETACKSLIRFSFGLYQRCAVDDDSFSFKTVDEGSNGRFSMDISAATQSDDDRTASNTDDSVCSRTTTFDNCKHLSSKWSTGTGPRIGCVRDYPTELQFRALEQVNLSPRVANGGFINCGPVPSPRPSPKVRLSPRIAHMGMPSPRTHIPVALS